MAGLVVLIDDDVVDIEDIQRKFRRLQAERSLSNIELVPFTSSAAGLEYLRDHAASLLILDVHIPDMDAIELLQRMNNEHIVVPVLLTTGASIEAMRVTEQLGSAAGAIIIDQVEKPLIETVLMQALAEAGIA